jgi:hypothetical protein
VGDLEGDLEAVVGDEELEGGTLVVMSAVERVLLELEM